MKLKQLNPIEVSKIKELYNDYELEELIKYIDELCDTNYYMGVHYPYE